MPETTPALPPSIDVAARRFTERPGSVLHSGSVMVFDAGAQGPLDAHALVEIVRSRLPYAPRYRQRLREVPLGIGAPVWVNDADVDLDYHLRCTALPRPGTDVQLEELVARVHARALDRSRPLWELYLVEGLEDGRFALVTKVHPALLDGPGSVDLAQLVLDGGRGAEHPGAGWAPGREPSDLELLTGAVLGSLRSPVRFGRALLGGLEESTAAVEHAAATVARIGGSLVRTAARPLGSTPLGRTVGSARRFVMVGVDLDTVRFVRRRHDDAGEHVSLTDVILATITGALRTWLEARGEHVGRSTTIRVLVPVSAADGTVMACFVDLPVGEPAPLMRLYHVAYQMRRQVEGGRAVPASVLAGVAEFTAPAVHAAGSRLATAVTRRLFNLVVTNAPGPQSTLTLAGRPMVSTFPVVPVVDGQALAIGVSSYDGGVFVGLTADRAAVPDLDLLGAAFVDALEELHDIADRPARTEPHPAPKEPLMARIYAPVAPADLAELAAGRSVWLAQWFTAPTGLSGEALEEAEYEALLDAAGASEAAEGTRRVVLAAEAPGLDADVPVVVEPRQVASFHVDETPEHSDEDLLWYDASELDDVIALAG